MAAEGDTAAEEKWFPSSPTSPTRIPLCGDSSLAAAVPASTQSREEAAATFRQLATEDGGSKLDLIDMPEYIFVVFRIEVSIDMILEHEPGACSFSEGEAFDCGRKVAEVVRRPPAQNQNDLTFMLCCSTEAKPAVFPWTPTADFLPGSTKAVEAAEDPSLRKLQFVSNAALSPQHTFLGRLRSMVLMCWSAGTIS